MNIERVIKQLEDEGYKVRITHERATADAVKDALERRLTGDRLAQPDTRTKAERGDEPVAPVGGKTTARILEPVGDVGDSYALLGLGVARCSPVDKFEKRVGISKALGRAIGELQRAVPGVKINTTKKD